MMKNEDIKLHLSFLEQDIVESCMNDMDKSVFKKDMSEQTDHGRNLYRLGVKHGVMRTLAKFNDKSLLIPMVVLSDKDWATVNSLVLSLMYFREGEDK